MAQRAAPAPFLTKTYQLVEEESTNDVVSWNEAGTTFVVWKMAEFARDLLPNYFKHNNFSSFVRQLNTYGFRKIVPDKWEFANDHFRRGEKELLPQIRRREAVVPAKCGGSSPSNSGGSTPTSSVEAAGQHADLSGENEKLRKDNESLSSELARTKKHCDELVSFLTHYLKVDPDHVHRIMRQGTCGSSRDDGDGDGDGDGDEESMKLFGVWVKKRAREEKIGCAGPHPKEIKMTTVDFHGGRCSKVCN